MGSEDDVLRNSEYMQSVLVAVPKYTGPGGDGN